MINTNKTTNDMELVENDYTKMLQETSVCKGLERVQESISCEGIQVLKAHFSFTKKDVQIIRSQWTKTQGGWAIRVNNFYAEKRHFLQVPVDTYKQCKQIISNLMEGEDVALWTGHVLQAKEIGTIAK